MQHHELFSLTQGNARVFSMSFMNCTRRQLLQAMGKVSPNHHASCPAAIGTAPEHHVVHHHRTLPPWDAVQCAAKIGLDPRHTDCCCRTPTACQSSHSMNVCGPLTLKIIEQSWRDVGACLQQSNTDPANKLQYTKLTPYTCIVTFACT